MGLLSKIVSSRARAEIFRLLFDGREAELHNRELKRRSGVSESAVRRELGRLTRLDLVNRREDGNRVYYRANRQHPVYVEIRNLVLKTAGLVDVLRTALTEDAIRVAFVFGSVAAGDEDARSDVDLMVVGDLGLRRLAAMLRKVHGTVGREVNPCVMTEDEYRMKIEKQDHFLTEVARSPKLFVIGAEDDLTAMGQ
jgi:DNA-binding transcriptional ArsR family regulator